MITRNDGCQYCSICATKFTPEWKTKGKEVGIQLVVKMMETLEENDDISVSNSNLRKYLVERWPNECPTRAHAALWIHEAIEDDILMNLPRLDTKTKSFCLSSLYQEALEAILGRQKASFDTSKEEAHIENLLWNGAGWMRKIDAISSLKATFEPMKRSRLRRAHVFLNAYQNGRFFVGKGPLGQTVVLNKEDVKASLERLAIADDKEEGKEGSKSEGTIS